MGSWNAIFKISSLNLEQSLRLSSEILEADCELTPDEDDAIISILFKSEASKPPVLQKARSHLLSTWITDILTCMIGRKLDVALLRLEPADESTLQIFNDMKEPEPLRISPPTANISQIQLVQLENTWKRFYAERTFGSDTRDVEPQTLNTIMRWYAKSQESAFQTDEFICLWIVFNIIYNYAWNVAHKKDTSEPEKVKYFVANSGFLSEDECRNIILAHPYVCYEVMPKYEFLGPKEDLDEAIKTKDIVAIEEGHKRYVEYQKKAYGIDPSNCCTTNMVLNLGNSIC